MGISLIVVALATMVILLCILAGYVLGRTMPKYRGWYIPAMLLSGLAVAIAQKFVGLTSDFRFFSAVFCFLIWGIAAEVTSHYLAKNSRQ